MTFVLDTTAFSDLVRDHPKTSARLASVSSVEQVVICPVVRGEVRYGIERLAHGRQRQALEARAAQLFAIIPCEPIPEAAGDHYASVKLSRQRKGLTLNENDLWIAATTLALGAVLVSRDSDFQQIDGLKVEDWAQ
jgi:tRNA(fMet)-specific endonuclease VapC